MSMKITTFKGLRKRLDKQVNAYFTDKGKTTKVTCRVNRGSHDDEVCLVPIDTTEKAKLAKVHGACWSSFYVLSDWPNTKECHNNLLKYCCAVGYNFKHKSKSKPVETVKVRETTDRFHDIEVGKEYTCMCKCDDHVCKGPWMIVRTLNVMSGKHESYYLVHNMTKVLDGGNDRAAMKFGYKHAWWLGDVGEEPQYKVELILPKAEEKPTTFQGIAIGVDQTCTVKVYEGLRDPRITEGPWKLVIDGEDVYLLSNCGDLDGANSTFGTDFEYSWWVGTLNEKEHYYKLEVTDAVAEPTEVPVAEAPVVTVAETPLAPLDRIAAALERIAASLEN